MKFMQIKPQKARGKFQESLWTNPAWSAETKYDGDRRIAQFFAGLVRFTGTRESVDGSGFVEKSKNIPQLSYHGAPPPGLSGTVLDGEIIVPPAVLVSGGASKYVTSIMGSDPERAKALQQERGWLRYAVFDCLYYKGKDVRGVAYQGRKAYVEMAVGEWGNKYAFWAPWSAVEETKRLMWKNAQEGLVFKHQDHTYGDQRLWVKLKKSWTADVVVMGFEKGKGKYSNTVGAMVFGQMMIPGTVTGHAAPGKVYLAKMGSCSGFDDALRDDLDKSYLNKVIEIEHNGREPTGAFRHPRFKRFRPDKSPEDCVYREDET